MVTITFSGFVISSTETDSVGSSDVVLDEVVEVSSAASVTII